MDERETTAVIDRALAGDSPAPGHPLERELQELTLALAAETPEPGPDFARQLDQRVALGFPRDGYGARLRLWRARTGATVRGVDLRLLGAAASVAIALVVAVTLTARDDTPRVAALSGAGPAADESRDGATSGALADDARSLPVRPPAAKDGRASSPSTEDAVVRPGQGAAALAVPVPQPGTAPLQRHGFAPGRRDRRIERSATLTLAAPAPRLDRVAADIATVTERHRGYVLSSDLATGDRGAATGGQFELRIPTARLDAALADLAKLAQVRSRTTAGDDVTAAFVTAGDRLQAARAERIGLLARLENATTDSESRSLRLQLDANAREVNRLTGRIRILRLRTDYAQIDVTLEPRRESVATPDGDGIGGALDDALGSLGNAVELAIRALGVALPLALLAAALALGARAFRRRRREAMLSES